MQFGVVEHRAKRLLSQDKLNVEASHLQKPKSRGAHPFLPCE